MSRMYKIEIFEPDDDGHTLHAFFEQKVPSAADPDSWNTAEVVIQIRRGWHEKTLAEIEAIARKDFDNILRALPTPDGTTT